MIRLFGLRTLPVLALVSMLASALPHASAADPACLGRPATIVGTPGADVIEGTSDADVIVGLGGDDVIRALGGDDVVCAGAGSDTVIAAAGDDLVDGGPGNDTLKGNLGADELHGRDGRDLLIGGGDPDILSGGRGADTLQGKAGDDELAGNQRGDLLLGGSGDDLLLGGGGDDELRGASGNDRLEGSFGVDELNGGQGADVLHGGPRDDVLWEVRPIDTRVGADTDAGRGDILAYGRLQLTPVTGTVGWIGQTHEGRLTITNRSDGLVMVERIAPERYLLGIDEMPYGYSNWQQPAALEAQVIAARTYLASVLDAPWGPMATYGFDICDWSLCQVYKGSGKGAGTIWEDAVQATEGQVLLYQGDPAHTFYHSTAGSSTRSIQDVWPGSTPLPYLQAVPVDPPEDSPFASWQFRLPLDAFLDVLARDGITFSDPVESIGTVVTDHGDGPYRVRFGTGGGMEEFSILTIQAALNDHAIDLYPLYIPSLHQLVGRAALSTTFTAKLKANGFVVFEGEGWGHQIGMSQYGALAMATNGSSSAEILSHFYTGLTPEPDPGFIPELIDVGLAYDDVERTITLTPSGEYRLRSGGGRVAAGTGGSMTITRHGNDAVALVIGG